MTVELAYCYKTLLPHWKKSISQEKQSRFPKKNHFQLMTLTLYNRINLPYVSLNNYNITLNIGCNLIAINNK